MNAIVACSGQSLNSLAGVDGFDITLGINRAPLILGNKGIRLQWWVMTDYQVFIDYRPSYCPKLCMTRECERGIVKRGHAEAMASHPKTIIRDDVMACYPREVGWAIYTKTAAIMFAAFLGASDVLVVGDDMRGQTDSDGHADKRNTRTEERWAREAEITAATIKYLADNHRVTVRKPN